MGAGGWTRNDEANYYLKNPNVVGFASGGSNCLPCPISTFKPAISSTAQCLPCPLLSNSTDPGASRCSCLPNAVNVSSSADPTALACQCAAGFEPSADNSSCLACGVGKAKAEVGNHVCECDSGYAQTLLYDVFFSSFIGSSNVIGHFEDDVSVHVAADEWFKRLSISDATDVRFQVSVQGGSCTQSSIAFGINEATLNYF